MNELLSPAAADVRACLAGWNPLTPGNAAIVRWTAQYLPDIYARAVGAVSGQGLSGLGYSLNPAENEEIAKRLADGDSGSSNWWDGIAKAINGGVDIYDKFEQDRLARKLEYERRQRELRGEPVYYPQPSVGGFTGGSGGQTDVMTWLIPIGLIGGAYLLLSK